MGGFFIIKSVEPLWWQGFHICSLVGDSTQKGKEILTHHNTGSQEGSQLPPNETSTWIEVLLDWVKREIAITTVFGMAGKKYTKA